MGRGNPAQTQSGSGRGRVSHLIRQQTLVRADHLPLKRPCHRVDGDGLLSPSLQRYSDNGKVSYQESLRAV